MKTTWAILSSVYAATSDTVNAAKATFPGSHVCGMIRGASGSMNDTLNLGQNESCIYRIKPEEHDGTVRINLEEASNFECNEMQLFILADNEVYGPYCKEKRRRRGSYSHNYGNDFSSDNHEIDMIYTNNGGMKFSFNFHFDFEFLPGLPGGQDSETSYTTSYGDDTKDDTEEASVDEAIISYGPGYDAYAPEYTKPAEDKTAAPTTAVATPEPETTEEYTTFQATTWGETTEATMQPTTEGSTIAVTPAPTPKATDAPTTEEPVYTTAEPVYTTEKPAYTTEGPAYTTSKAQKLTTKYVYPTYKPTGNCPWEGGNQMGDCPGVSGKCNLKYFRICGESFFNRVYDDICRWQDAKQLIPMFTKKLVPLGSAYEKVIGTPCNGYGYKSIQSLMGDEAGRLEDGTRDVATCKASAGAPPCHFLDFSEVTTARQFHVKMEELYSKFLKFHCNKEWGVHFEALLVRMRHSLFCDDGSQSDHPGYVISTAAPTTTKAPKTPSPTLPYGMTNNDDATEGATEEAKTASPTLPYGMTNKDEATEEPKTAAPTLPYGNNMPTDAPSNNPTDAPKTPKPTGYSYPGPAKVKGYCPWTSSACEPNGCPADCPNTTPPMCSLKFVGRCYSNIFNKVYKNICRWEEALQLMPEIYKRLTVLGTNWEKHSGKKCNANVNNQRGLDLDPSFDYDFESAEDMTSYRRRRQTDEKGDQRDVAKCEPAAGKVPCSMMDNLNDIKNENDFYFVIEDLVKHVGKKCNGEWNRNINSFLIRVKNSLICKGGIQPDGR